MKLLIFLEHRFYLNLKGEIFCERVVDYHYLERYLNVFEEVCICARVIEKKDIKMKLKVDGEGISLLKLPDFKGSMGLIKNFYKCRRIINKNIKNYDAIILRAPSPISFMALNCVEKSRKKFETEIVINPKTAYSKLVYPNLIYRFVQYLFTKHTKRICLKANGVSYVTEKILQKEYPSYSIKYGETNINFHTFYSTIDLKEQDFSKFINIKKEKNEFVICHTGYMDTFSKGHLIMLRVLKELILQGYNVKLKLIGTGKLEEHFKNIARQLKVEDNVSFLGQIFGFKNIQKELISSDLFLFLSASEGLPRSLIEAMANSLPCIATPIDGIVELLDERYLVDYGDINRATKLVKKFINDYDLREQEGKNNYKKALEFSEEILKEKRNKFYKKLRSCL